MRTLKKSVATILLVVALAVATCFALPVGAAFGAEPAQSAAELTYGSYGALSGRWYYGEGALDIGAAKEEIGRWDLSSLDGGSPIVIAVVDTGINFEHEIFDGVLLTNSKGEVVGHNSKDGETNGKVNIGDESSYHGTKVAGVIAVLIKELGLENYIKIYPIKANTEVNGKDAFMLSEMLDAISYARNIALDDGHISADVVNLSFGNSPVDKDGKTTDIVNWRDSKELRHELTTTAENAVIVAAAGNYGKNADEVGEKSYFYPAAMQGVLSVMGYGPDGLCSDYNYGSVYDIAAPAKDVVTASTTVGSASQYCTESGTSMATPFVSFAAALLKLRYKAMGGDVPNGYRLAHYLRNISTQVEYGKKSYGKLSLDSVVAQDFSTVPEELPTAIEVTNDGKTGSDYVAAKSDDKYKNDPYLPRANEHRDEIFMIADQTYAVQFHARLVSQNGETGSEFDSMIEWVLVDSKGNETVLGNGTNLTYTPTDAFGATKIICRCSGLDNLAPVEIPIFVCYKDYMSGSVCVTYLANADDSARNAPTSGVLYTTKKTTFTLTELKYLDPDVPIKWYVNGKLAGEGSIFTFRPTRTGQYVIGAQYGDNRVMSMPNVAFYADVHTFMELPLDMSMVILACAIALGVATTLIVIAVRRKKASALPQTPDDATPSDRSSKGKFAKGESKGASDSADGSKDGTSISSNSTKSNKGSGSKTSSSKDSDTKGSDNAGASAKKSKSKHSITIAKR